MGIHGSIHACCKILFNCLARIGRDGIGLLIRQTHTYLLESRLKRVLAMTGSALDRFDDQQRSRRAWHHQPHSEPRRRTRHESSNVYRP